MDDERLMELVEENDVIYNKDNRYNHSFERKRKVWAKIAKELNVSEEEVMKRYRVLRDRFVKFKRMEILTGSENKYRAPIVDKMEFLTPHVFIKSSNGEKITWASGKKDNSSIMSPMRDESTTFEMSYSSPAVSPEPPKKDTIKRKLMHSSLPNTTDTISNTSHDTAFREALQCFKKLCQSREERQENEALHGFGQMIIATIAGMSEQKQTKAMMRVTEIVMRVRMEDD